MSTKPGKFAEVVDVVLSQAGNTPYICRQSSIKKAAMEISSKTCLEGSVFSTQ
jgi:hypothetical protein